MKFYNILIIMGVLQLSFAREHPGQVNNVELDIPKILNSLFSDKQHQRTVEDPPKYVLKLSLPDSLSRFLTYLSPSRRQQILRPKVIMGPGTIKSEIIWFPKDQLKKDLMKLIRILERKKAMNKKMG